MMKADVGCERRRCANRRRPFSCHYWKKCLNLMKIILSSKIAIDMYHHYKEDIALFAEMGFKTYRMSIA